ncbi:hypothetical protein ACNTMW_29585 [Planosporangium sp. 12N6]|uniref:hypothetical protein n=1 Tax=Planosporangium spinosum TaxID=3402278 RepID=UPI003CE85C58
MLRVEDGRLVGSGAGRGVPLGTLLTYGAIETALVRLGRTRRTYDPRWLAEMERRLAGGDGPHTLAPGADDGADWLRALICTDPLLRMYCAVPGGRSPIAPWPAHPAYPGGTVAVTVADLTVPARIDVVRVAARHLARRAVDPAGQLLEDLVRPLAAVFRVVLDRYGIVLDLDPARVAVELSPERQATGRIVVGGAVGTWQVGGSGSSVEQLLRCLDLLAAALARVLPAGSPPVAGFQRMAPVTWEWRARLSRNAS